MSRRRQRALAFGLRAESLAAAWLRLKFYTVLDRNFSAPGGEIDLVVRRGDTIAFVEVKVRPTLDEAVAAIDKATAARISRAARMWFAANPSTIGAAFRGDAVLVAPWRRPRHVEAVVPLDLYL